MKTSFRGFGKRTLSAVLAMLSLLSLCVVGITSASAAETEIADVEYASTEFSIYISTLGSTFEVMSSVDNSTKAQYVLSNVSTSTNIEFLMKAGNDYLHPNNNATINAELNTDLDTTSFNPGGSGNFTLSFSTDFKTDNPYVTIYFEYFTSVNKMHLWIVKGSNSSTTYTVSSTDLLEILKGNKIMLYAGHSWSDNNVAIKNTSGTAYSKTTFINTSGKLSSTYEYEINGTNYKLSPFIVAKTSYYLGHSSYYSPATFSATAGGVYLAKKGTLTTSGSHTYTKFSEHTDHGNYYYSYKYGTPTTTVNTTAASPIALGSKLTVSTTAAGSSALDRTNTVKYYIGSGTTPTSYTEYALSDGQLNTSSLAAGTYTLKTVLYDGIIYVVASTKTFVIEPKYYFSYWNGSENLYSEMTKSPTEEGHYYFSINKDMISTYLSNNHKFKITKGNAVDNVNNSAYCVSYNSPTISTSTVLQSRNVNITNTGADDYYDLQLAGAGVDDLAGNIDLVIDYVPTTVNNKPSGTIKVWTKGEYDGTAGTVTVTVPTGVSGVSSVTVGDVSTGTTEFTVGQSFTVAATAAEGYTVTSMKYGTQTITGASGTFIAKKDVTTITINVTANSGATGTVTVYFKSAKSLGYVPKFTVGNSNTVNTMTVNGAVIGNNTTNSGYYYWYSASVSFSGPLTLHFSNGYALNADYTISAPVSGNSYYLGVDNLNCGTKIYDMTSWAENKRNWCESAVHMIFGTKAGEKDENLAAVSAELSLVTIGDANLDGKVNVKDATFIQKVVAGIVTLDEVGMVAADVDMSGAITVKDATAVQKQLAALL